MARPGNPPGGVPLKSGSQLGALSAQQQNQMFANLFPVTAYAADGAIAAAPGIAMLTKGSAGAYTLAAPAMDGIRLVIQAGSGFAHVVTTPSGTIQDGTTGAKTTYTTVAFIGSGIEFVSYLGKWNVVNKNLGTVA